MSRSARRPKAVAKKKLATTAKCRFNNLMSSVIPALIKRSPATKVDTVHSEADVVAQGPVLPLYVMWVESAVQEDGTTKTTPQVSLNEFAIDEFLNQHVDPTSAIYGGVRSLFKHALWIDLIGDEGAAAHIQNGVWSLRETQGVSVEPAVLVTE